MRPVDKKFPVSFGYGIKSKLYRSGMHKGVDFACPVGTPVVAMKDGIVSSSHWGPSFGNHVIIANTKFADGSAGLWAGYMHLSAIKVKPGQRVKRGEVIGLSGVSGNVTGPHLHVEVQKKERWNATNSVDPKRWINF